MRHGTTRQPRAGLLDRPPDPERPLLLRGRAARDGGRRAARHRADGDGGDAAADHVQLRAGDGADHAGRHLLRRAVRRLDDGHPDQPAGRVVGGGHRARRSRDGPPGPGRPGPGRRRDRVLHRGYGGHRRAGRRGPTAGQHRAAVRPGRVLLAGAVRPDRVDRAGARLDAQGAGDDRARRRARHGRPGHLHRHAPVRVRPARTVRRHRLRVGRRRHVRGGRDPAQPGERADPHGRRQQGEEPLADPRGPAPDRRPDPAGHRSRRRARRAARRRPRAGVVHLVRRREADLEAAAGVRATARSRASPAPSRRTTPPHRRRSSRCSPWVCPPTR